MDVGRNDDVTPGNIVGAIANEAGVDSQHIGQIKLHDDYSTVDLPEGMPKDVMEHLQKVRVCNKPLLFRVEGAAAPSTDKPKKKKIKAKSNDKKPKAGAKKAKPEGKAKVKKRKTTD